MTISDIAEMDILKSMLEIMTPSEIYNYLPSCVQWDIDCEIEDRLEIELERE